MVKIIEEGDLSLKQETVKEFKAVTLYFSGACNLQCSYCFQPKLGGHMNGVNKEIQGWISSGKMEEDIEKEFGSDVEIFALWGGEPSMNLPELGDRLFKIKERFPHFRSVMFSTNISTRHLKDNVLDFIRKADEFRSQGNEFSLEIQFSLDGPSDFNDVARIGSNANDIVDNIRDLLREVNGLEINKYIQFSSKATHSAENIARLKERDVLIQYYTFFDEAYEKWDAVNKNYPRNAHLISFVYPGNYVKEDGENLLQLLHVTEELNNLEWKHIRSFTNQLDGRLLSIKPTLDRKRFRNYSGEFINAMNCSAGAGFIGLSHDGSRHLCQGSFFFDKGARDEIEKKDLIFEFEKTQGFSFRNFDDYIKNKGVVETGEDLQYLRFLNNIEQFRSTPQFRLQYFLSIIPLMASAGMILEKYKDVKEAEILAAVCLVGGNACPSSNLWEFGSYWVSSIAILSLLGNGVVDYVLGKGETH